MDHFIALDAKKRCAEYLFGLGVDQNLHEAIGLAFFHCAPDARHRAFADQCFASGFPHFRLCHSGPPEGRIDIKVIRQDAVAEAAMKRAIEIDAIADVELQAADRILQEIQSAAPGSAPILEAGAAAWLVRSNAYTQAALTELMRLRAVDLANAGADLKIGAQQGSNLRESINGSLRR